MNIILLILSLLMLSQAAALVKLAHMPASVLGFWRLIFTCIPLLGLLLFQNKLFELKKLNKKNVLALLLCGFALFLHWYLWLVGVPKTAVASAVTIFALNPIFTSFGAFLFFKERYSVRVVLALFLGVLSFMIMSWGHFKIDAESARGNFLVFLSAMCFSIYILLSKNLRQKISNVALTFSIYTVSMILFFVLSIGTHQNFTNYPNSSWIYTALMALLPTLLGHALFTYSLNHFNVNFLSFSTLLQPIFAAFTAYFIFDETLRGETLVGFLLIGAGMWVLYGRVLVAKARAIRSRRI